MAEAVQVVFQIDQPGTAAAKLKSLDQLLMDIGVSAAAAGVKIDSKLMASYAKLSPTALTQINAELLKMPAAADKAAASMVRLDPAAQRLAGSMEKVSIQSGRGAVNISRIQNSLAGIANIPEANAVEQLGHLAGLGGPVILLLTAVAVGLKLVNDVFVSIKDESVRLMHVAEKFNQMNRVGMKGGLEESKTDLENIRKMRAEVIQLTGGGFITEANELQVKTMGRVMTLSEMNSKFDQAERRLGAMGGDIRDPVEVARQAEKLKNQSELQKKLTGDFNEINRMRLDGQIAEMDHAVKLRKEKLDTQTELEKRRLDSFNLELQHLQKVGSIVDEQEKLRAGLGGADLRSKAAGISEQGDILKKAIREAMIEGREFGPGGRRELLGQFDKLGMSTPGESLAAGSVERGLKLGQDQLAVADSLMARAGALDQILASTSNIGMLTSDQVDARMKALTQRSGVEMDLKKADAEKADAYHAEHMKRLGDIEKALGIRNEAGVKIVLKDESGGALKAELGEAPTPESSGAVSSGLTQSSAFRNDPMSGRL